MSQGLPILLPILGCVVVIVALVCGRDQMKGLRAHWIGALFLVPFLIMFCVHRGLGLSDSLMLQTPPGEPDVRTFNLIMVCTLIIGIFGFMMHGLILAERTTLWLSGKFLLVGLIICLVVLSSNN